MAYYTGGDPSRNERGEYYTDLSSGRSDMGQATYDPYAARDTLEASRHEREMERIKALADMGMNPDGSPIAPEWESLLGESGLLEDQYQIGEHLMDPTQIAGYGQYEDLATGTGLTAWGEAQQEKLGLEEGSRREDAIRAAQSAQAQAESGLAMRGGLSSGARERIAMGGAKDVLSQRQKVARDAMMGRADISAQDAAARQQALQGFVGMGADIQQYNVGQQAEAERYNIEQALAERAQEREYGMKMYEEEGKKWAAEKKAEAQRKSSGGGGGGCCFIFLEARYGDGTMDSVVRRFRDEHMTDQNKRGYYKLSEVLVPLMRRSKIVKFLVRATMTDPLVSYGKFHYGEGKIGKIFSPIKNMWLRTFDYLGKDHKFIRENGEEV